MASSYAGDSTLAFRNDSGLETNFIGTGSSDTYVLSDGRDGDMLSVTCGSKSFSMRAFGGSLRVFKKKDPNTVRLTLHIPHTDFVLRAEDPDYGSLPAAPVMGPQAAINLSGFTLEDKKNVINCGITASVTLIETMP